MLSYQLGDRKNDLPVGEIGQDLGGHPVTESSHSFGMARRTKVPAVARVRQPHFTAALRVFTVDTRESVAQVATVEESVGDLADDRSPEAVLFGKAIVVNTLELIEVVFDQPIKRRGFGIAWKIDACDSGSHIPRNGGQGDFANRKRTMSNKSTTYII